MSAQQSVLQVVILRDGLLVGTEVFVPGSYTLGSGRGVDLRLDDPAVAERHAILYFRNGKAAIQDAGASSRGIYVNGHRVTACEVRSVDEVTCGPFVLKARVLTQKAPDQSQLPPEVAALLGTTPAAGSTIPDGPKTAFSARKLAQMQAQVQQGGRQLRPAIAARDPSVEELFSSEHPTTPLPLQNAAPARAPSDGASGQFMADRALSPTGNVVASARGAVPMSQRAPIPPPPPQPEPGQDVAWPELWPTPAPLSDRLGSAMDGPMMGVALPDDEPLAAVPAPAARQARTARPPPPPPDALEPAAAPAKAKAAKAKPAKVKTATRAPKPQRAGWFRKALPTTGAYKLPKAGFGAERMYFELHWGRDKQQVRAFVPRRKRPIIAAARDSAPVPLYGFGLEEDFVLGEPAPDGYRLNVPPRARVEKGRYGGEVSPLPVEQLEGQAGDGPRFVTMRNGDAVRLTADGMTSVYVYVAPPPAKELVNPFAGRPYLLLVILAVIAYGFGTFLYYAPGAAFTEADFESRNVAAVAVRLIAPEPKRKERAKEVLKEMAARQEKNRKRHNEAVVTRESKSKKVTGAIVENKALKALARLQAAGPAMGDILAAVDKQGSGPGSKNAKRSGYALSGLIGKGTAVGPGKGTWGLGGGGTGKGTGTLGAELLRGKGGGGIGALGAGGFGRGSVGGTVARASPRTVGFGASSGSIDREAVAKVVNDHIHQVQSCYERALLKDPGLSGKVVLEWTIGTNGRVTTVKTKSSTLRSSSVEGCIMSALKSWVFPPPRGGSVIISYPFMFNSVGF